MRMRLDEERCAAELEITAPTQTSIEGILRALQLSGLRTLRTVEYRTPRYHVSRSFLEKIDGSSIELDEVPGILRAAESGSRKEATVLQFRAA